MAAEKRKSQAEKYSCGEKPAREGTGNITETAETQRGSICRAQYCLNTGKESQKQRGDVGEHGGEVMGATGRAVRGTATTGKRKASPMMGTSAMNTLRMEFATLKEGNTRV